MKGKRTWQSSRQVEDPTPIRASFARAGEPKTSEYAFFKKLKEDAGQRFQSQLLRHPQKSQSRKSTELLRERTIDLDNYGEAAFKSSLLPKNVTPDNSFSFASPLATSSNKSEQYATEFHKAWGGIQTLQENMAAQDRRADVFPRKRQKLCQWVVDTSFPENDKLCSNGCDFVAALLSRLFSVRNEENTGLMEIDTKSKSFPYSGSDNYFKEFHGMPVRNLVELEFKLPMEVGWSPSGMEIPIERDLSNSSPPIHYPYEASHDYRMRELEFGGDKQSPGSSTDDDSTCDFHTEKYGSHLPSDFRGLDEPYYPRKSFCRKEPYPLFPGWDFENMVGSRYSVMTDLDMQLSVYPISTDSQGDGKQWKHESGLDDFLYPNKSCCGESYPLLLGWDFNNIIKQGYPSMTDPRKELSLCPHSSYAQDDDQRSDSSGLHGPTLLSYHPRTLHLLLQSPSPIYGSHNFREHLEDCEWGA